MIRSVLNHVGKSSNCDIMRNDFECEPKRKKFTKLLDNILVQGNEGIVRNNNVQKVKIKGNSTMILKYI